MGVADQVTFTGSVPSIAPYLLQSHVLVLPFHSEGIPRVLMEAFAAGVPVIGTAIPGIMQLVKHEVTGLLVPLSEPAELAMALHRIGEDTGLAQRMAFMARQVISEKFSARRMADDFHGRNIANCAAGHKNTCSQRLSLRSVRSQRSSGAGCFEDVQAQGKFPKDVKGYNQQYPCVAPACALNE